MIRLDLYTLERGLCLSEMIEAYKITIITEGVDRECLECSEFFTKCLRSNNLSRALLQPDDSQQALNPIQ